MRPADIHDLFTLNDCYNERFDPGKPISPAAMAVHHILDEDLVGKRPSHEFTLPADTQYIIGHNVDFDWQVVGSPDVKRVCTLALSRMVWPQLESHNLSALLYYLSADRNSTREKLKNAHSALADVESCLLLLFHLVAALNPPSWEALWLMSEQARIPTVMPFGKHRGQPISSIPADYKRWLLNQPDIDPYLIKALGGK